MSNSLPALLDLLRFPIAVVLVAVWYHLFAAWALLCIALIHPPQSRIGGAFAVFLTIAALPGFKMITRVVEWAVARYPDHSERVTNWLMDFLEVSDPR